MDRIISTDLKKHENQTVTIQGWLHKKRELSANLTFLMLRDRGGLVQIVIENPEEITKLKGAQVGTIISVVGLVKLETKAVGELEIHNSKIEILNLVTETSPIELDKDLSHESENFDTLFEYRVLGLRNLKESAIFKIQESVINACREFLQKENFTEFRSPKLLAEATEGGAETFELDYFGKKATLAQSAQFYKQIMVGVFERIFEIGATYRAEQSFTPRHMTEFTTLDVEIGFIQDFSEVLDVSAKLLKTVVDRIWHQNQNELNSWDAKIPIFSEFIPKVSMSKLHELYFEQTGIDNRKEKDPSPDEEKFICQYAAKNWGSEAVFITEFPSSEMKFYHYKNRQNPEVCDRADLIFRGVEIATLSRRENDYQTLISQMKRFGLNPENVGYKNYLLAFKHGLPAHGGFGIGVERLVQKIIGLKSVKEATLFPRDVNRLSP